MKARILFMDDEAMIRSLILEYFADTEITVEAAENGLEALRLFRSAVNGGRPFDAVVLDIYVVGGMSGLEVMQNLREIDPGIKGIVITGYREHSGFREYRRYGFSGAMAKPLNLDMLKEMIEALISRHDPFPSNQHSA